MKKVLWVFLIALFLLSACASGPTIATSVFPGTDFSAFRTYNFIQPLGTDRDNGARTPFSTRLISAMDAEMKIRGLTRSDNSPDLLVDFTVSTQERIDVRSTPSHTVHRSHWNRGFSTWPTYSTQVRQYTEGTLIIDLIHPATVTLVGEGGAQSRIRSTELTQEQIDNVVRQIMADLMPQ